MERLIDANKIENRFVCWLGEISKDITNDIYQGSESDGIAACLEEIRGASTIDPESLRPHGKWVKDQFSYRYLCTNCKMTLPEWMGVFNYCPCCGAKMED